jgi:hypothetical protein
MKEAIWHTGGTQSWSSANFRFAVIQESLRSIHTSRHIGTNPGICHQTEPHQCVSKRVAASAFTQASVSVAIDSKLGRDDHAAGFNAPIVENDFNDNALEAVRVNLLEVSSRGVRGRAKGQGIPGAKLSRPELLGG